MRTKKKTRAQFLERVYELAWDIDFVRNNATIEEPGKFVTLTRILQKGETVTACNCQSCGTKYVVNDLYFMYSSNAQPFKCPVCGNIEVVSDKAKQLNKKYRCLLNKTDDGFEFVNFWTYTRFSEGEDWYDNPPEVQIQINNAGVFDNEKGFFMASKSAKQSKVIRRNSFDESNIIYNLKRYTDSNVDTDTCKEMLAKADEVYAAQRKASEEKSEKARQRKADIERENREKIARWEAEEKEKHRLELLNDVRAQYQAKDIDIDANVKYTFLRHLYSTSTDGTDTYLVACAKCGVVKEVSVNANNRDDFSYACDCGNHTSDLFHFNWNDDERHLTTIVFENTNLDENDLLIRVFETKFTLSPTFGFQKTQFERKRIFAGKQIRVYSRRTEDAVFDYDEYYNDCSIYNSDSNSLCQSNEDVVDIIRNSCLKYSGLIDVWGLGAYKYKYSCKIPDFNYLSTWYKKPGVEMVLKSNLSHITDYTIDKFGENLNHGNNLAAVLGIEDGLVKNIVKIDPTYSVMHELNRMYRADNTVTKEIYDEIKAENLSMVLMIDLAANYGIKYSKTLQYLQTVYDHQCIDKDEALSVWSDYLRMANTLGVDLSDKSKKFPTSLRKEHDVAVFAYRAVKVEMDQKAFAKRAEVNKFYEFEHEGLMAIVPTTPQEIIEEANAQRNCLRSYVDRVRKGQTVVVFVRKKDEPEKTFLSAEILDGHLTQLKGFCNSDPRTKEIVEFVKEWSAAKDFKVRCKM